MKSQWKVVRALGYILGILGLIIIVVSILAKAVFLCVLGIILLVFGTLAILMAKWMIKEVSEAIPLRDGEIRFSGLIVKSTHKNIPLHVHSLVSLYNGIISLTIGAQVFNINVSQVLGADTYGARTNAAGAVITGITGVDSKQRVTQHFYTYINFISEDGETHQIDIEVFPPLSSIDKFNKAIVPKEAAIRNL